jgi:hypothetical protein
MPAHAQRGAQQKALIVQPRVRVRRIYKFAVTLVAPSWLPKHCVIHNPLLGASRSCKALLRSCAPATPLNLGKADPLI